MERLNKLLARAGVASRRAVDRLIEEGRVSVNGSPVAELGSRVDPEQDNVKVDGRRIELRPRAFSYFMLNKPKGCVTTLSDPEGRPTVSDLLQRVRARVFPVGRLDYHSEGLLLLTDDGDLANVLTHPRHGVAKTYSVKVRGTPDAPALERLRRGVSLDGRRTLPAKVAMTQRGPNSWLEITIKEGRKQQVRRMFESQGHLVVKLRRIRYGGLELGDLAPGELRRLGERELERLRRSAASPTARKGRAPRRTNPRN